MRNIETVTRKILALEILQNMLRNNPGVANRNQRLYDSKIALQDLREELRNLEATKRGVYAR